MHVAILGNGITGVTAALRLRALQPDWRITMVSGESTYPYSRPALMYIYMGHMGYQETKLYEDKVWSEQRIELKRGWVARIAEGALHFVGGEELGFDRLLIATGAVPNKFGWPGQDLNGVQGFYSLMDLKRLYAASEGAQRGVIVGGGLIGLELAEMLHSRGIAVSLLVREPSYWSNILPPEESAMVNAEIFAAGMDLRLGQELDEVLDDGRGRAKGVRTKAGAEIEAQIVGLTAGVSPNKAIAEASGIACGRGVLVDRALRTQTDNVWAAGDCAEIETGAERNWIQQVWYTGKAQGKLAAESIAGQSVSYAPGIWFNSAKFLDLEYQTYGEVPTQGGTSIVAQANGRLLRLVHKDGRLIGLNAMGTRIRHRVVEGWIRDGRELDDVIAHLADAAFDPEFYRALGEDLVPALQQQVHGVGSH